MSIVQKINCPDCGSNSTFKTIDGNYKCNYCQGTFIVNEPSKNKIEIPFNKENIDTYHLKNQNNPVLLKYILFFTFGLVALIGGIVAFSVLKSTGNSSNKNIIIDDWQAPTIFTYKVLSGSKGSLIFLVTNQQKTKIDSVRYFLKVINPKTLAVIKTIQLYKTVTWQESFNFEKKVGVRFWQYGNLAFSFSEENGLKAYDIYSLKEELNNDILKQKFPELNNGIAEIQDLSYKKAFKFITNNAEEFIYYPLNNVLKTKEDDDNAYKTDGTVKEQLYVSDGKQPSIYKMKSLVHESRDALTLYNSMVTELEQKDNNWYKKSYEIDDFIRVNETNYFKSMPFCRYNSNLVLMYTSSMAKSADVIIESVDTNGKTVWQLKDTVFQYLKTNLFSDKLYCEFCVNQSELIINTSNANENTISINLNNGKINWILNPKKINK